MGIKQKIEARGVNRRGKSALVVKRKQLRETEEDGVVMDKGKLTLQNGSLRRARPCLVFYFSPLSLLSHFKILHLLIMQSRASGRMLLSCDYYQPQKANRKLF